MSVCLWLLTLLIPLSTLNAQTSIKPFLGRWDLTMKTPARDLPSWIEISEERGGPRILMVGIADHATPLRQFQLKSGQIEFLSPKGEEGFSEDMAFKGKGGSGVQLVGTATGSSGTSWPWMGRRAPSLKRIGAAKWGKPITLFDGKDFTGWRFSDRNRAGVWKVQDGTLLRNGNGAEIITTSKFEDFKLHVEFNCGPQSNSGVYLRGRYEVQIVTDLAGPAQSPYGRGVRIPCPLDAATG